MTDSQNNAEEDEDKRAVYRILVKQPVSIELDAKEMLYLSIQGVDCRLSIRPEHDDAAAQHEAGGAILAIEFEQDPNLDLIEVARVGLELVEDFLSALSVVSGVTFERCRLVQVAVLTDAPQSNCEFIQFNPLPLRHWHQPITRTALKRAENLLAHWDYLDTGKRLRRAAERYRIALGTSDDIAAFQQAYVGLEALEKPLAMAGGLTPGTEEAQAHCPACKHISTYKKSTLVGVRAFVHDTVDLKSADLQRQGEWKLMHKLRNDLAHGLEDLNDLGDRPHNALLASMHYLHDAICHLSHASHLNSETFILARGGTTFVIHGQYTAPGWPVLSEWKECLGPSPFTWVDHQSHGLVPQMIVNNSGLEDLEFDFGRISKPFAFADEGDIESVKIAFGGEISSLTR